MRTFSYFARAYPLQSTLMVLCLVLASLLEGVGITTLLPLLSIATGGSAEAPGGAEVSALENAVRVAIARAGIEPDIGSLLAIMVIAVTAKAALVILANRQVGYAVAHVATDLRLSLLRALLATRWSYTTRQPIGATANAVSSEAQRASNAFHHFAQTLTHAISACVYAMIAFAISWKATLGAAAAGAVTVLALGVLVRRSERAGLKQTRLQRSLLGRLTDALGAAKLLKATGREDLVGPLLERDTQRLNRQLQRRVLFKESLRALQEPILVVFVALGLFVTLTRWGMPLSSVGVLLLLFAQTLDRIHKGQRKYQEVMSDESALWSLREMIERAEAQQEVARGTRAPALARGIALEKVRVVHRESGAGAGRERAHPVLEDLSLEIPAGEITALVGPSGAGKTTIVDLLTGLVTPEQGRVRVDGVPLEGLDVAGWRRAIGYVPQDAPMLHDSVAMNVTLGDPGATPARVESALCDAGAWDFVSKLPDGVETSVGERGALLSGGQRQRIAIARALVHEPALLILDEATAGLDRETEDAVWKAVARLRGRTTVVAVSHQPALQAVADRAYRIENGRARPLVPAREVA